LWSFMLDVRAKFAHQIEVSATRRIGIAIAKHASSNFSNRIFPTRKIRTIFVKYFGCIARKKAQYPVWSGGITKVPLNRSKYYGTIGSHKNNEGRFITLPRCFGWFNCNRFKATPTSMKPTKLWIFYVHN